MIKNIFKNIPENLTEELLDVLIKNENIKVERIISKGHKSPAGFWYDQEQSELVLLLKGSAKLRFENELVELNSGDYINIPAHKKHRVDWTDHGTETIWLAIYY